MGIGTLNSTYIDTPALKPILLDRGFIIFNQSYGSYASCTQEIYDAIKQRYEDTKTEYTFDCPVWALPALINNDHSGLSASDESDLNQFFGKWSDIQIWDYDPDDLDNPRFNSFPAFGLPTDTVKITGIVFDCIYFEMD